MCSWMRSGVTDQLRCGERGARERWRALAPEKGEHAKGVFQLFVTGRNRRERDPIALVLRPIPSDAETKVHPAPGEDIQGGHGLPQDHRMAVPDPGDERPQSDPAGDPGQECKRGVGLWNVLPLPADLGDLTKVVHHPQVVESGHLGPRRDGGKTRRHLGAIITPIESVDHEPEAMSRPGPSTLGCFVLGSCDRGGHQGYGLFDDDAVETIVVDFRPDRPKPAELPVEDRLRDRPWALRVPGSGLVRRGVEHDGEGGEPGLVGENSPSPSIVPVEAEGVDHRRQTPPHSLHNDLFQDREGRSTGLLVILTGPHHSPKAIRGHDLRLTKRPGRPGALARTGRANQHYQAWRRQT